MFPLVRRDHPSHSSSDMNGFLPLKGARVAFTGKLASLTRQEAFSVVRSAGGQPAPSVSRQTSLLVVGMEGWPLLPNGMISAKLRRAEALASQGSPIRILSEAGFLELVGIRDRASSFRKAYPAEEVCRLLGISAEVLRRWEQFSLVRSDEGRYDFQDLVSLRTIAELVRRGVKPMVLAKSLERLASILPGTERPLAQLRIVSEHSGAVLVDLGDALMAPNGQLVLNFDARPRGPSRLVALPETRAENEHDWFDYGQACEDEEHFSEAEAAYRRAIMLSPQFPEAYFNLGNVLRLTNQHAAAEECYRTAVAQAPHLACAWYNLADILEERGKFTEAVDSLQRALKADPNYADAHFNLALCLEKIGQKTDAKPHWAAYLKLDSSSQWSSIARRHLALE
ncbi:MAG: tetratricopeptide repeat protein [Acidobacteriota bacterium]